MSYPKFLRYEKRPPYDSVVNDRIHFKLSQPISQEQIRMEKEYMENKKPAKVLNLITNKDEENSIMIDILKTWIRDAKAGRVTSLVVTGVIDGVAETNFNGKELECIAAIEISKGHIMDHLRGEDEDEDEDEDLENPDTDDDDEEDEGEGEGNEPTQA